MVSTAWSRADTDNCGGGGGGIVDIMLLLLLLLLLLLMMKEASREDTLFYFWNGMFFAACTVRWENSVVVEVPLVWLVVVSRRVLRIIVLRSCLLALVRSPSTRLEGFEG